MALDNAARVKRDMAKIDVETLNLKDWPAPEAYLVEVGRIALVWRRLETFVCNSVANLAGLENLEDPKMYSVFADRNFQENLALLERLCQQQLPQMPNLSSYQSVLEKLSRAELDKNYYMNGSMRSDQIEGGVEMTVWADELTGKTTSVPVRLSELKKVVLSLDDAQHELYKLVCALDRPGRRV